MPTKRRFDQGNLFWGLHEHFKVTNRKNTVIKLENPICHRSESNRPPPDLDGELPNPDQIPSELRSDRIGDRLPKLPLSAGGT